MECIPYIWNLKYNTNEVISETEADSTDTENRLVGAKGEEIGEGSVGIWGLAVAN